MSYPNLGEKQYGVSVTRYLFHSTVDIIDVNTGEVYDTLTSVVFGMLRKRDFEQWCKNRGYKLAGTADAKLYAYELWVTYAVYVINPEYAD